MVSISGCLGALTGRTVHPASPVLLTKNGPLGMSIHESIPWFGNARLVPIQSLRIGEGRFDPRTSNHSLDLIQLAFHASYPEGNFGGNQLLDGSMSLSPLYPDETNDLHVSIATSLHRPFGRLHPLQA